MNHIMDIIPTPIQLKLLLIGVVSAFGSPSVLQGQNPVGAAVGAPELEFADGWTVLDSNEFYAPAALEGTSFIRTNQKFTHPYRPSTLKLDGPGLIASGPMAIKPKDSNVVLVSNSETTVAKVRFLINGIETM